jgi:hypothetical protein
VNEPHVSFTAAPVVISTIHFPSVFVWCQVEGRTTELASLWISRKRPLPLDPVTTATPLDPLTTATPLDPLTTATPLDPLSAANNGSTAKPALAYGKEEIVEGKTFDNSSDLPTTIGYNISQVMTTSLKIRLLPTSNILTPIFLEFMHTYTPLPFTCYFIFY